MELLVLEDIKLKLAEHFEKRADQKMEDLVGTAATQNFHQDFLEDERVLTLIELQVQSGAKTLDQATEDAARYYLG